MTILITTALALAVGWWLGRGVARVEYRDMVRQLVRVNEHNQREVDRMAATVHALTIRFHANEHTAEWPEVL